MIGVFYYFKYYCPPSFNLVLCGNKYTFINFYFNMRRRRVSLAGLSSYLDMRQGWASIPGYEALVGLFTWLYRPLYLDMRH
jgi:hypothetical protein